MNVVYATATAIVTMANGARVRVEKGQHWPADDPVVATQPSLFSADPRWGLRYTREPEGYDAPIEMATAAPGERRTVRRDR